ncbi:MAG: SRPBCC family protein [Gemmatales bacterium]|nr:SRPBCC family protein [Gemmatales bacterium]MDW8386423.1 SRPBCC family protein [Gemmatales bacterium]
MREYILEQRQIIPRPLDEVFPFFADAGNLERITPEWLRFEIVTPRPIPMAVGTRIEYRIRWRFVSLSWLTEITEWNPPYQFVDVQLKGPYSLWHHTHRFESVPEGTLMTDIVRYALPWGPIGTLAHWLGVRRDLERIFAYRRQVIEELFPPVDKSAISALAASPGP